MKPFCVVKGKIAGQPSGHYIAGKPVHGGYQVQESTNHPDVGDIGTPFHSESSEQIQVDLVLL